MKKTPEREALRGYIRARLTEETKERGAAARIAKSAHISSAHITYVVQGNRGVGDDMIHALAAHWGTTYAGLTETALTWAAANPQPADVLPRRLEAARLCREHGVPEEAVAQVLAEPQGPESGALSVLGWADRMRYAQLRLLSPDAPAERPTDPTPAFGLGAVRRKK